MALADDLLALRDRVLADLNSAHDYFTDTQIAWDITCRAIAAGHTFSSRSIATGTLTTHTDLAQRARGYVVAQLAESTFQQFVSIFESFVFDLLRHWLLAYPRNLLGKQVDFRIVLDASDKDAITRFVVSRELNEILYDRPAGWFVYLEDRAKLGCPTTAEIEQITEAKASRDVLVHNRGMANKTYELKAGNRARYWDGERIEIPEHYHGQTWELFRKVVTDVSNAAIAKVS